MVYLKLGMAAVLLAMAISASATATFGDRHTIPMAQAASASPHP